MNLHEEQRDNLALIGRFINGLAHNINTPLSAIIGRSEMVQMRIRKLKENYAKQIQNNMAEELDKTLRDVTLIIENTDRVSGIIRNVTQKSSSEQSYTLQPINLALLAKEEFTFLQSDMTFKHKIEKSFHLNEKTPSIMGIYSHFSNSFFHIIDNSMKAMEETEVKKLTVLVDYDEQYISIQFNDTGCGIDDRRREQFLEYLNDRSVIGESESDIKGGFSVIKRLLSPYKPIFDILSNQSETTFSIRFPLKSN